MTRESQSVFQESRLSPSFLVSVCVWRLAYTGKRRARVRCGQAGFHGADVNAGW